MTAEERIAQLEAEVRSLRLVNEGLAVAVRAANLRLQQEGDAMQALMGRREAARLKKQRQRALKGMAVSDGRSFDVSRDTSADMSPGHTRDIAGTPPLPPSSSSFPSSFPPSSEPPSSYPLSFPPSSPTLAPSASQGEAAPSRPDGFNLEHTGKPVRQTRKQSAQEALYRNLECARESRCAEVGEPFIPDRWSNARQNKDLGELVKASSDAQERFVAAWGLYLADDGERARTPAWSLGWFMAGGVRAKYETMAAREEAA